MTTAPENPPPARPRRRTARITLPSGYLRHYCRECETMWTLPEGTEEPCWVCGRHPRETSRGLQHEWRGAPPSKTQPPKTVRFP